MATYPIRARCCINPNAFEWTLRGRAYKVGHDMPHADAVIPGWLIAGRHLDPRELIPHLFADVDPGFHERARAGDIIIAGRNFGMGPKANGYIAMQALGLGLLCVSMPHLAYRAAIGVGLRTLTDCVDVWDVAETGEDLEVDFANGLFTNHTRGLVREYPAVPEELQDVVALGGNTGWLKHWWAERNRSNAAGSRD